MPARHPSHIGLALAPSLNNTKKKPSPTDERIGAKFSPSAKRLTFTICFINFKKSEKPF